MKKIILLSIITLFSVSTLVQAKNYYIRMSTNTSDWSGITADLTHVIVDYTAGADFGAIINAYASSDVIWVAKGTYTIATAIIPKTGMNLIGGFNGNENALTDRAKSDLDGNGIVEPWEFTNAAEIVSTSTTIRAINYDATSTNAIVDGFTVKGINFTTNGTEIIRIDVASTGCSLINTIVKDCNISSETSDVNGAVNIFNGTIHNCLIQDNTNTSTAKSFGGGLQINGGSAIPVSSSSPQVIGCVIRGNKSNNSVAGNCRAGGVYIQSANATSFPKMINSVIYNNQTQGQGGGIYLVGATSEVVNCTVVNNKSALTGGGVFMNAACIFYNSIVWANINNANNGFNDIYFNGGTASAPLDGTTFNTDFLAYGTQGKGSNVSNYPNLGNIETLTVISNTIDDVGRLAPKFLSPTTFYGAPTDASQITAMEQANFKLGATSPCIDYAYNSFLTDLGITTDLLGNDRFVNYTSDLGAYESTPGTGIQEVKFQYGIYSSNQHIILSDLPLGQMISIYNYSGQLIKNEKIDNSNMTIGISKGLYLVRVANQATKVIVQ